VAHQGKGLLTKAKFAAASGLTLDDVQRMIQRGTITVGRVPGSSHDRIPVIELSKARQYKEAQLRRSS
jgi:hypothetical protein